MTLLIFNIGLFIGFILAIGLVIDILIPTFDLWPHTDWGFLGVLEAILWVAFYAATLATWVLGLPPFTEFSALTWLGLILFILGTAFLIWAMVTLKIHVSLGVKGELVISGPYRLCRNPQTTGLFVQLLGALLMTFSPFLALLASVQVAVLVLAVVKEERWLEEQYGEDYREYQEQVPRRFMLDIRTVKTAD